MSFHSNIRGFFFLQSLCTTLSPPYVFYTAVNILSKIQSWPCSSFSLLSRRVLTPNHGLQEPLWSSPYSVSSCVSHYSSPEVIRTSHIPLFAAVGGHCAVLWLLALAATWNILILAITVLHAGIHKYLTLFSIIIFVALYLSLGKLQTPHRR